MPQRAMSIHIIADHRETVPTGRKQSAVVNSRPAASVYEMRDLWRLCILDEAHRRYLIKHLHQAK